MVKRVRNPICVDFSNDNISADSSFQILLKSDMPYDTNQTDSKGRSLLMLAGLHGLSVYQDLLRRGADAKALDHEGNTVLHHYFAMLSSNRHSKEMVLEGPAILKSLILAGADCCHVNSHGQLPHEVFKIRSGMPLPASVHLVLARCVLHEALRRIDIDTTGISIKPPSNLQTYTDERSLCCFFQRLSFSLTQDRIHLESLAFEDQITAVLECCIITQKMMIPFLPNRLQFLTTYYGAKVREPLSEFKSKRTGTDRAGSTGVRPFWEEPYPQSKMELHESKKQQNSWQDCSGVTFDCSAAKIDLPELCERCQRKLKEGWEYWEDREDWKGWEDWKDWEDWEVWEFWSFLGMLREEKAKSNTQSEEHMDMDAESQKETDSDTKSEEDYFSAEEA